MRSLRIASLKTTASDIVLSMVLILSACTAENHTGREYTAEDRNGKAGIDSKSPTSETPIGYTLANKRFMSVDKKETGLGPNGVEMGHWFIDFSSSTFEWTYSDVVASGSYVLDEKHVVGQSGDRQILGDFDPSSGILTWDGSDYRIVDTEE